MESVSKRQSVLMGIVLVLDAIMVSLPNQIIELAKMDAWVSYLVAMAAILIPLFMVTRVLARFPGKDLFGILVFRFPLMGRAAALIMVGFFFIILVRDIRVLTEFVNITLLPSTPLIMISMLVVITIVLTTRGGIEVIARMMELWLPLFILMILVIPFLLYSEFETHNLLPVFDKGLAPPLQGSWYAVAYIGEIILLPFLLAIGSFRFKEGFLGLAIGTVLVMLVNLYLVLSLGVHLSGKMIFPLYEMVRLIRLTDFLDRFDMPYILIYLPLMITKVAIILYALAHGIKRIIPAISFKDFLIPLGVWSFVSSFWFFQNSVQLFTMNRTWPVVAILCEIGLPFLFFFLLHDRKKESKLS